MSAQFKTIRDRQVEDQLSDLSMMFGQAFTHNTVYKKKAIIDRNFYDGFQWSEDELRVLRERKQPPVVYNRIKPIVNTILSLQRGNRSEIAFKPYDMSEHDFQVAKAFTMISKHDTRQAKFESHESMAFKDYVITGRGVVQAYYDQGKKRMAFDYVDFRDFYPDPASKLDSLEDADHVHIASYIDETDLKILYPEYEGSVHSSDMGIDESFMASIEAGVDRKIRLVQSWIRVPRIDEMTGMPVNEYDCFIWVDGQILKHYVNPYPTMRRFPVMMMTLYRDLDNHPYGVVRDLIDPQRVLNHSRSKAAFILNTSKYVYRRGSFEGDEAELASKLNQPNALIPLEDGANDMADISPKSDIQALIALMEQSQAQIPEIAGVGEEVAAQTDKSLSGRAIALRQQSGLTRLTEIFDGLQRFREAAGQVILSIIRDHYDLMRVARLLTAGGDEEANDLDAAEVWEYVSKNTNIEFDIVTGVDPVSLTQQSEEYQNLLQIFALNPQGIPVKALVQFSNMANKHEILQVLEQTDQQAQAMQQMQYALEQQKQMIEQLQKKLETKDETILKLLEKVTEQVPGNVL